jgi:hypothetical protein
MCALHYDIGPLERLQQLFFYIQLKQTAKFLGGKCLLTDAASYQHLHIVRGRRMKCMCTDIDKMVVTPENRSTKRKTRQNQFQFAKHKSHLGWPEG